MFSFFISAVSEGYISRSQSMNKADMNGNDDLPGERTLLCGISMVSLYEKTLILWRVLVEYSGSDQRYFY